MRFTDKVVVVTGAGSGIGRASAERFAREGAAVVVADIDDAAGAETVQSIVGNNGTASFVALDSASYDSVAALIDETVHRYGKLDIMFNNAGVGNAQLNVLDLPIEEYHRTIGVNQHGVFYGIKAAGNVMKQQGHGGVIINTASIYGFVADRRQLPYHASKAAVAMMTKAAALELARYNIRVVAIAPGLIDTNIVAPWKAIPQYWTAVEQAQMRGRAGTPEEVANVVAFLGSDEASFVNGTVFFVDDGAAAFKR